MTEGRFDCYRRLAKQLGQQRAHALMDRLQVLALTQPDTLREMEAFIGRGLQRFPFSPHPERRRLPDRRTASLIPEQERRREIRRAGERSVSV